VLDLLDELLYRYGVRGPRRGAAAAAPPAVPRRARRAASTSSPSASASTTAFASASASAATTRAREEAARVPGRRLGLSAPASEAGSHLRLPAFSVTLPHVFERVLAAQRASLRAGDPAAPALRAVAPLSEARGVVSGVEEWRAARRLEVEVPAAYRWLLGGVAAVELREELLALPAARWAVVTVRNANLRELGALLEQSVFSAAEGGGTRWQGLLDLSGLGFRGGAALRFLRGMGAQQLVARLYRQRLAALQAALAAGGE